MASPSIHPVLFVGHGSPLHGIQDSPFSRAFSRLGTQLARPDAVLVVSAHWETEGPMTTGDPQPETLHDFGGFPDALHQVRYPAPGAPLLAKSVAARVGGEVRLDRGLDHGTWTVLRWMFPDADVPVLQLSIDLRRSAAEHLAIAQHLRSLRESVLILGSGNITHNLRDAFGRMRARNTDTPDWAARFDHVAASMLEQHDHDGLVRMSDRDDFRLAHPTPEHWIPLLYAAGAAGRTSEVDFPITGFDAGSLSMRAVRFD